METATQHSDADYLTKKYLRTRKIPSTACPGCGLGQGHKVLLQAIYELNYEIIQFENEINKEIIESFIDVVTKELDAKRSSSLYSVTNELKEYKETVGRIENFPQELVEKLHQVINGEPIETIIYELDDIRKKYIMS